MQLEIEKLAFGGRGVGRVGGKVVFVKGGLPGEVVKIEITKNKGNYTEAQIQEVLKPSPERIQPPCPVFEKCGGCQWQHLEYPSQLRAKEDILRETLERIGGIKDVGIEPIVSSPKEYGYRTRVALSAWFGDGKWHIGYYEEESHRRVAIERCPVASEEINEAVFRLSKALSSVSDPSCPLETVYISSGGSNAYITLLPGLREDLDELRLLVEYLKESVEIDDISIAVEDGEKEFEFNLLGLRSHSIPSVFIQANKEINELLIQTVVGWADLRGTERVLDLYSGIGNFSLRLAKEAKEVVGVEINEKAVRLAEKSREANSADNVLFKALSCELFLRKSLRKGDRFDLIVLDPPREGTKATLENLAQLSPQKIVYVSCDPATLARDLKKLGQLGYETLKVRPFDMFPQTYHIESAALLVKV